MNIYTRLHSIIYENGHKIRQIDSLAYSIKIRHLFLFPTTYIFHPSHVTIVTFFRREWIILNYQEVKSIYSLAMRTYLIWDDIRKIKKKVKK